MADERKSRGLKPAEPVAVLEAAFWAGGERIPTPGVRGVDIDQIQWAEGEGFHFTVTIKLNRINGALSLARACKGDALMVEISDGGNPVIEGRVKSIGTKSRKGKKLYRGIAVTRTECSVIVEAVRTSEPDSPRKGGEPGTVYHCPHGPEGEKSEKLGDTYRFASGMETRAFICHECNGLFAEIDNGRAVMEGSGSWSSLMRRPGGLARIHTLIAP